MSTLLNQNMYCIYSVFRLFGNNGRFALFAWVIGIIMCKKYVKTLCIIFL